MHVILWSVLLAVLAPRVIPLVSLLADLKHKIALQHKMPSKLGATMPGGGARSMAPSKESAAAAQVEGQIAQAVAGELTPADEQKLLAKVHENLIADAEKLQAANPTSTDADMDKMTDQMKQDAFSDVSAQLKDMANDALQSEINSQLNGGIYDQVKNVVEQGVGTQMSQAMADKLRDRLNQERQDRVNKTVAGLEQAKKMFTDAAMNDVQPASGMVGRNQMAPAADATKKGETDSATAEQAANNALADAVKNFPQTAAQADTASKVLGGDTQQALQAATNDIAAKNQATAGADLSKANDALTRRIAALSQLQDQVRAAGNAPDTDPVSQNLAAQSMADMQKAVGDQLQNQSMGAMNSAITDRLTQALTPEAGNLNVSPDQLKAMIEAAIKAQLAAQFKDHAPDTAEAVNKSRDDNHLLTADEVEQARLAADAALKQLQTARQTEAGLPLTDTSKIADDLNKQQTQATAQYDAAHDSMEKARDLARAVSVQDQNKVFAIGDSDRKAEADTKLNAIPDLVNADQRAPADQLRTQVVQGLDERIGQMTDLENSLGAEKNALAAQPKPAAGPAPKIDPTVAAGVVKDMKAAADKIASDQLPGILAAAGQQVQGSDTQSTNLRMVGIASLLGKVGQLQSNMAEGRPGPGLEGAGMGFGLGMGHGTGPMMGKMSLYGSRFSAFNAAAIEQYGKYLRDRTNPANFYSDAKETDGAPTVAQAVDPGELPATVYFGEDDPTAPGPALADTAERKVPDPAFKTVAFGAAAMMDHPITIDGDLSDWGELRHPMPTRFRSDGVAVTDPTQVYVRWSPDGLYIGYTVKKNGPIVHDAHAGDCMEVWIDGQNVRRKQMADSPTSQQIFLAPFGYQNDPSPAIVEVGRGTRGLKMFAHYADRAGLLGKVAAKIVPGGYSVEAFLSRKAIAYPNLIPGAYLAFNFSVNRGPADTDWEQWSTPKSQMTWDKPDTWGDLLLLGSDAKVRFISADDPSKPVKPLIPGEILAFEVQDKDMDLNPHKRDQVPAVLRIKGDENGLFVILEETANDSGIFRGSVNTQPYEAPPKENTLNIRGGESVELLYNDLRNEYGEPNRAVTADLPIGSPVLRLAGRQ